MKKTRLQKICGVNNGIITWIGEEEEEECYQFSHFCKNYYMNKSEDIIKLK